MNILYVGPYRQQDGWGRASKDYLKALIQTGHNIAARPIWMSRHITNIGDQFVDNLESVRFSQRPDVVIQNVLPYYGEYQHGMRNILQMYLESGPLIHTNWPAHMNLFDKIWVPTVPEYSIIRESNVNTPVNIIPMPLDFEAINPDVAPYKIPVDDEDFVFYFIGEYVERKNLAALLIAFHREFKNTENARLLIKTNLGSMAASDLFASVEETIKHLYKTMRLYSKGFGYIRELIITESLTHEQIMGIHKRCHCFVMPSRGESTCRPVIEALAMGNQAIVTANTGMAYAATGFAMEAESVKVPATCQNPPFPYIYTANEEWHEVQIIDLQRKMRLAYELHQDGLYRRSEQGMDARKVLQAAYSYENVAQSMKEAFNDI